MVFRASNQVKADGYSEAKRLAVRAKSFAQSHQAAMAAGDVSANLILQMLSEFKSLIERWTAIAALPGVGSYAIDQENDAGYSVGAEFAAVLSAAAVVRDRIIADMPVATAPPGVVGRLAIVTIAADGSFTTASFTPAQTANLRADLANFIATIS